MTEVLDHMFKSCQSANDHQEESSELRVRTRWRYEKTSAEPESLPRCCVRRQGTEGPQNANELPLIDDPLRGGGVVHDRARAHRAAGTVIHPLRPRDAPTTAG